MIQSVSARSYKVESSSEKQIEERLGVEALATVIMNFESDCIEQYGSLVASLYRGDISFNPKKLDIHMKHQKSPPAKPSIEQAPKLKLKALPPHLRYVFLGKGDTLPITIASDLNMQQV